MYVDYENPLTGPVTEWMKVRHMSSELFMHLTFMCLSSLDIIFFSCKTSVQTRLPSLSSVWT